jgi:hypothetical protein
MTCKQLRSLRCENVPKREEGCSRQCDQDQVEACGWWTSSKQRRLPRLVVITHSSIPVSPHLVIIGSKVPSSCGAYLNADMEDHVLMKINSEIAQHLIDLDPTYAAFANEKGDILVKELENSVNRIGPK